MNNTFAFVKNAFLKYRRMWLPAAAFFIPFAVLLVLYALNDLAPFGDNTLMMSDAYTQYSCYWLFQRSAFAGEADIAYSLGKALGDNTAGLYSYYLASPLNFIFSLFPAEKLPVAFHLVILLKLSLSGLTSALFFDRCSRLGMRSLLLSTAYALCAYNMCFLWCTMWLDGAVMLPLIALGLHSLVRSGRPWLYIVSLGLSIVFSYYIGYMLCAFSVIYYIYLLALEVRSFREINWRSAGLFALSSLTAGALSAVLLLPAVMSMTDSKYQSMLPRIQSAARRFIDMLLGFAAPGAELTGRQYTLFTVLLLLAVALWTAAVLYVLISKRVGGRLRLAAVLVCACVLAANNLYFGNHILAKLFTGTGTFAQIDNGGPNIFVGILALVLFALYFANGGIEKREKIAVLACCAVFVISMSSLTFNMMWHGMAENVHFNYRYSFIVSFFILTVAARSLEKLECLTVKRAAAAWGAIALGGVVCLLTAPSMVRPLNAAADIVLAGAFIMLLVCRPEKLRLTAASAVAVAAVLSVANLGYNADFTLGEITANQLCNAPTYSQRIENGEHMLEEALPDEGDGIFRIVKDSNFVSQNDPIAFGYAGATHFSSTDNVAVIEYMRDMGIFAYSNIWASCDKGASLAAESLLGIKYCLNPGVNHSDYIPAGNGLSINPYVIPVGFVAPESALDTVHSDASSGDNPFEFLNTLYRTLFDAQENVFTPAQNIQVTPQNLSAESVPEGNRFSVTEPGQAASLDYAVAVSSSDALYLYAEGPLDVDQGVSIYVNGEYVDSCLSTYSRETTRLGAFEPGETVTVSLVPSGSGMVIENVHICHESKEALKYYHDLALAQKCVVEKKKDSRINAQIAAAQGGVAVFTIPFDSGWKARVDGKRVPIAAAADLFMAIPVAAGEHELELVYTTPGLAAGILLSLAAAALVAAGVIAERRNSGRAICRNACARKSDQS